MSVPKRRIDIDPETPVREITGLLEQPDEEIAFRVGKRLFVIHETDSTDEKGETPSDVSTMDGVDGLLAIAGSMKGIIDGEALKKHVYELRDLDAERELRIAQARANIE